MAARIDVEERNNKLRAEHPGLWHWWRFLALIPHGPGMRIFISLMAIGTGLLLFDPFDITKAPPCSWFDVAALGVLLFTAGIACLLTFKWRMRPVGRAAAAILAASYGAMGAAWYTQAVTLYLALLVVICLGAEAAATTEEYCP